MEMPGYAVQKFMRKAGKRFVAASCHYDIIEWMQPDRVFEPATMHFARRGLQRRPALDAEIRRVPYDYWRLFAPYHYLTAELNPLLLPVRRGATGRVRWCSAQAPCESQEHQGTLATRDAARPARARAGHDPREESGRGIQGGKLSLPHLPGAPVADSLVRA